MRGTKRVAIHCARAVLAFVAVISAFMLIGAVLEFARLGGNFNTINWVGVGFYIVIEAASAYGYVKLTRIVSGPAPHSQDSDSPSTTTNEGQTEVPKIERSTHTQPFPAPAAHAPRDPEPVDANGRNRWKPISVLAILLNAVLICLAFYLWAKYGAPRGAEVTVLVIMFAAPVFSIVALWQDHGQRSRGLLGLLLERKRLEEQQRIEALRSKTNA